MLILMRVHGTLIAVLLQITGSELQSCLVLSMNCYFSFGGMLLEKEQQQLSSLMLLVQGCLAERFRWLALHQEQVTLLLAGSLFSCLFAQ